MVQDYGDIPSGSLYLGAISHASVASNGAAATYGGVATNMLRVPCACRITGVQWSAVGADQDATQTASYRLLTLINGGAGGAGTTVLASLNLTASLASNNAREMTVGSAATLSRGETIYLSQGTVGGDHSNGTVLRAGNAIISYRPI